MKKILILLLFAVISLPLLSQDETRNENTIKQHETVDYDFTVNAHYGASVGESAFLEHITVYEIAREPYEYVSIEDTGVRFYVTDDLHIYDIYERAQSANIEIKPPKDTVKLQRLEQ